MSPKKVFQKIVNFLEDNSGVITIVLMILAYIGDVHGVKPISGIFSLFSNLTSFLWEPLFDFITRWYNGLTNPKGSVPQPAAILMIFTSIIVPVYYLYLKVPAMVKTIEKLIDQKIEYIEINRGENNGR